MTRFSPADYSNIALIKVRGHINYVVNALATKRTTQGNPICDQWIMEKFLSLANGSWLKGRASTAKKVSELDVIMWSLSTSDNGTNGKATLLHDFC